jgi:hypothetical protein
VIAKAHLRIVGDDQSQEKQRADAAQRQRRRQQRRKAGMKVFPLPLPEQKVIAAVQVREHLDHPPTKKQILASLQEGFNWWVDLWVKAGQKPHA